MKNSSFSKDYRESLELLVPYVVLLAVGIAAITSTGSWAHFFDKTLPRWFGIMTLVWLVFGAYAASMRRRGGVTPSAGGYADDDSGMEYLDVNPSTGMPMMPGGVDVLGNPAGTDLNDH
jgi:hypothetical protein